MANVGIDISAHTSDHVHKYAGQNFDLALTVCDSAREKCPFFLRARRPLHHNFEDPDRPDLSEGGLYALFARIRDFSRSLLSTELKA